MFATEKTLNTACSQAPLGVQSSSTQWELLSELRPRAAAPSPGWGSAPRQDPLFALVLCGTSQPAHSGTRALQLLPAHGSLLLPPLMLWEPELGEGQDWWKPDGEISNKPRGLLMSHRSQLATWPWKIITNTSLQGFCSFLFHQYFGTVELFPFILIYFLYHVSINSGFPKVVFTLCNTQEKLSPLNTFSDHSEYSYNYYSSWNSYFEFAQNKNLKKLLTFFKAILIPQYWPLYISLNKSEVYKSESANQIWHWTQNISKFH